MQVHKEGEAEVRRVTYKHLRTKGELRFVLVVKPPVDADLTGGHECSLKVLDATDTLIVGDLEMDDCIECPTGYDVIRLVDSKAKLEVVYQPHDGDDNGVEEGDLVEFRLTVVDSKTQVRWSAFELTEHFEFLDRPAAFDAE